MIRLITFVLATIISLPFATSFVPVSTTLDSIPRQTSIRSATFITPSKRQNHATSIKHHNNPTVGSEKKFQKIITSAVTSIMILSNIFTPLPTLAAESRVIGEVKGSGIFFKDTLVIESFDDPKVKGVTLYISNFQKPLTEKLSKGELFSDPSFASVGCAKSGPIQIADNIATGAGGEEVFEEAKSLLFKTLRVQRIYDKEKNTVVYVSFNTRFDKNNDDNKSRFKSSTCAVYLD